MGKNPDYAAGNTVPYTLPQRFRSRQSNVGELTADTGVHQNVIIIVGHSNMQNETKVGKEKGKNEQGNILEMFIFVKSRTTLTTKFY